MDEVLALVERAEATLRDGDFCCKHQSDVLVSAFQEVRDRLPSCVKMRELVTVMERGLGLMSSYRDDFLFQALLRLENREEFKQLYTRIKDLIYLKPGREMDYAADLDKKELIEKCQNLTDVNTAIEIVRAILNGFEPPTIDYNELEVESYIGQGNSGAVFEATWLDRSVAVKFLGRGDDWLSMERPSENLINMKHPNLVSLLGYSFETEREQHVLVTEKMTSRNLAQLSSRHRTRGRALFSLEDTIEILLQIATGMEYLHSRNELHKGLKPSNIFVDKNDSGYAVKIGDFGLGTTYWASDTTRTGSDLSFMAPEVRESNKYTKHADIYSYGVICDQLLTASLPHEASARNFDEQLPNDLVDLIANCLSETVKERPTFSDVRDRLELVTSTPPSPFQLNKMSTYSGRSSTLGDHAEKEAAKEIIVEHQQEKAAKDITGSQKASSWMERFSSEAAERENYKLELSALVKEMESASLTTLTAKVRRFQFTIFYEICVDVSTWTIENTGKCLSGNSPFEEMMTCFKRALKLVQDGCVAEWPLQAFSRHHCEQEFRTLLEDMKITVEVMAEQGYGGKEMVQFRWEDLRIAAEKDKMELLLYAKEYPQNPLSGHLVERLTSSSALHPLLSINSDDVTLKKHDVLGQGVTATVYAGEWLNQPVALKVLGWVRSTFPGLQSPSQSHPNVLRTFGCVTTQDSQLIIVMELMRMDLRRFLDQMSNLSLLTAVDIMLQIARGVRHLHQHGVTYAGVKTQSILVTFDNEDPTVVNVRVPEVRLDMSMVKQDKWDTYSFGHTCSEILTWPFQRRKRPYLTESCPKELKDLINKCWSTRANERPAFKDIVKHLVSVKRQLLLHDITGNLSLTQSSIVPTVVA